MPVLHLSPCYRTYYCTSSRSSQSLPVTHLHSCSHTRTHTSLSNSFPPWSVRPYMTIFFSLCLFTSLSFQLPALPSQAPWSGLVHPACPPPLRYVHTLPPLYPPHVPFKRCTGPASESSGSGSVFCHFAPMLLHPLTSCSPHRGPWYVVLGPKSILSPAAMPCQALPCLALPPPPHLPGHIPHPTNTTPVIFASLGTCTRCSHISHPPSISQGPPACRPIRSLPSSSTCSRDQPQRLWPPSFPLVLTLRGRECG